MKDIVEVLQQKEEDIQRVRREVEALRVVAPLLGEDDRANGRASGPQPIREKT